ncbi:Uncharacterised protein [uncultured Blautia sp.]|nr:Uncharacterised protein [uncultured Blautia sp.]
MRKSIVVLIVAVLAVAAGAVVLSLSAPVLEDGLFAVYQDPDWSYAIREGEALAAAVEALLPA